MENKKISIVVRAKAEKKPLDKSIKYWAKNGIHIQNAYLKEISWTNKDGTKHKKEFQCFKTDSSQVPELVFCQGRLKKSWV